MALHFRKKQPQEPITVETASAKKSAPAEPPPTSESPVLSIALVKPPQLEAQQALKPSPPIGLCVTSLDAIPQSLKSLPNFGHWRNELDPKGKPTKVPYRAGLDTKAATDKPESWTTFAYATGMLTTDRGLAFNLPSSGGIVFIDLDHVRDPKTGTMVPWALRIIELVNSYTEISPSGTGNHIYAKVKGTLPPKGSKKKPIELYTCGRFATITGDHLPATPDDLQEVDVTWLYRLIEACVFKFKDDDKYTRLFHNIGEQWKAFNYPSQSEADLAICSFLRMKLANDADGIDQAFRLSGLMSRKWDEARGDSTYGRMTILKAIGQEPPDIAEKLQPAMVVDSKPDFPYTPLGNAERFVAQHRHNVRFDEEANCWLLAHLAFR